MADTRPSFVGHRFEPDGPVLGEILWVAALGLFSNTVQVTIAPDEQTANCAALSELSRLCRPMALICSAADEVCCKEAACSDELCASDWLEDAGDFMGQGS